MKTSLRRVSAGGEGSVKIPHVGCKGLKNKRSAAYQRMREIEMLKKQLMQDKKEELFGRKPKFNNSGSRRENERNNRFSDMDWGKL